MGMTHAALQDNRTGEAPSISGMERGNGTCHGADAREEGAGAPSDLGPGFTVRRAELLREIDKEGRSSGIVMLVAPDGFGKTGLMLQYVDCVANDPERGTARMMDASHAPESEVADRVTRLGEVLPAQMRPLIAIDDLPVWTEEEDRSFAGVLRDMRDEGFEFILSTVPANEGLVRVLGDSARIGAQALRVRPREYARWARAMSISNALDVYELTQGIPSLVSSLASSTPASAEREGSELGEAIGSVYRGVLLDLGRRDRQLLRLARMMVLMGRGSFSELERCGVRARPEQLSKLARDYLVFGVDPAEQRFRCVGCRAALKQARTQIASECTGELLRAARTLLRADRIDEAADLVHGYMDPRDARGIISQFPAKFALAGYGGYVVDAFEAAGGVPEPAMRDAGSLLALYVSALTMGNVKLARQAASGLARVADHIEGDVSSRDWELACALSEVWSSCKGLELPEVGEGHRPDRPSVQAGEIRAFAASFQGGGSETQSGLPPVTERLGRDSTVEVDVPYVLYLCAVLLNELAAGGMTETALACDRQLGRMSEVLRERHLSSLAIMARMADSAYRLFSDGTIVDERAFVDAETMAVRTSNHRLQLISMLFEGWQHLEAGQFVNAQFRAQQIQKLAGGRERLIDEWAIILESAAHVRNTSRVALNEEAEMLDLGGEGLTAAELWAQTFCLAAARLDGELAAWFSLKKGSMLLLELAMPVRLALHVLGDRAASIERLAPADELRRYRLEDGDGGTEVPFQVVEGSSYEEMGQLYLRLFGGFHASRNGHVLTDGLWRRRKSSVLISRLVLAFGSFVSRRVLTEELWPAYGYDHARNNLYTTLSTLRRAMGQTKDGPQYLLLQGEGIAINREYVVSDILQFESLSRYVLLKRTGISAHQTIEACLKIEQLYTGDLFIPDMDRPTFFLRMRDMLLAKFCDCMLRGVEAAIDEGDRAAAQWMVEAALRRAPGREDVIRAAMRVYDLCGRRREVVTLYQGHLHVLEAESHHIPEPETRRLYEEIISRSRSYGLI